MPTETGLRETLRWTTQDVHDRLHENPSFLALMDGTLSLADYAALMQRLYGFYAAVDVAIRKALPASAWCGFDYAPRAPLLSDDVASLHPDLALAPARDIRCTAVAGIVRPDTVLGVLYVVEGAGGREREAEEDAGGADARCCDAEGDVGKKLLRPGSRRRAVDWAMKEKSYS